MDSPTDASLSDRLHLARRSAGHAVGRTVAAVVLLATALAGLYSAFPDALEPSVWRGLVALAGLFVVTRGLMASRRVRTARHLFWAARRRAQHRAEDTPKALPAPQSRPESASQRAVRLLTAVLGDEAIVHEGRAHGLSLASRLDELKELLADPELQPTLRRPVAEEATRLESELEGLLELLAQYGRADRQARQDLAQRLEAHIETESLVPAGLLGSVPEL
ncbi:MAG: hypothetical protein VX899_06910 [Myxococcota bacterium]|nr:hypothetical protein [Myxococcota bacterium]